MGTAPIKVQAELPSFQAHADHTHLQALMPGLQTLRRFVLAVRALDMRQKQKNKQQNTDRDTDDDGCLAKVGRSWLESATPLEGRQERLTGKCGQTALKHADNVQCFGHCRRLTRVL